MPRRPLSCGPFVHRVAIIFFLVACSVVLPQQATATVRANYQFTNPSSLGEEGIFRQHHATVKSLDICCADSFHVRGRNAVKFGAKGAIEIRHLQNFLPAKLTFAMWLRPDFSGTHPATEMYFLTMVLPGSTIPTLTIGLRRKTPNTAEFIRTGYRLNDLEFPLDDKFHHFAITLSEQNTRVYVDGQLIGDGAGVNFLSQGYCVVIGQLQKGCYNYPVQSVAYKGDMGDVQVYGSAEKPKLLCRASSPSLVILYVSFAS